MNRTITKKRKCKKAKWFSEEVLQTAEEKREVKTKGEREIYTQQNAVPENSKQTRRLSSMNNANK